MARKRRAWAGPWETGGFSWSRRAQPIPPLRILDGVFESPETGDLHAARVAGLHPDRRLAPEPDARRGAGRDEIAGRERHQPREVADEVADVEDEVPCGAVLHEVPVHPGLEIEDVRIPDLAAVGDVGADRRERVGDLAGRPLARDELKIAGTGVVDDRVAPDVVEGRLLRDEAGGPSDDDAQLDLPVQLGRASRSENGLAGIEDRVGPLGK